MSDNLQHWVGEATKTFAKLGGGPNAACLGALVALRRHYSGLLDDMEYRDTGGALPQRTFRRRARRSLEHYVLMEALVVEAFRAQSGVARVQVPYERLLLEVGTPERSLVPKRATSRLRDGTQAEWPIEPSGVRKLRRGIAKLHERGLLLVVERPTWHNPFAGKAPVLDLSFLLVRLHIEHQRSGIEKRLQKASASEGKRALRQIAQLEARLAQLARKSR